METSVHYAHDTPLGILEWNATLPPTGGTIYLGEPGHRRPFTISLFHEIRCLDIIREGIRAFRAAHSPETPDQVVHHCMNYIRQMVLCRSNTDLESVHAHVGPRITVSQITHRCRDWDAVYDAAKSSTW
jgi:hypothetical protein